MNRSETNVLYHYTDYIALDGILNHGELRLNNILNMNDEEEMRFFMNHIRRALTARLAVEGRDQDANRINSFLKNEMEEEFHFSAYAACFSRYRDDAAQWERYGKYGQGVCIGFYENVVKQLIGDAMNLQDVIYQFRAENVPVVEVLYQKIISGTLFQDMDELNDIMRKAWSQSYVYKHPSFSSENEVRLVALPFAEGEFPVTPRYHISQGRIKKYYPFMIKEACQRKGVLIEELVKEIIIGPTSTQSIPILQDYLKDCGMGALAEKIHPSECPLRKPTS